MLSVIIVTYNSRGTIGGCLDSLSRSASIAKCEIEIICIDNASTDSTADVIAGTYPSIRLIRNAMNSGFAAGVNTAAKEAHANTFLFLNPDTIVADNLISELESGLRRNGIGAIFGCRLVNADGSPQSSCYRLPTLWTLFLESVLPYGWSLKLVTNSPHRNPRTHPPAPSLKKEGEQEGSGNGIEVEIVTGAAMAIRRDMFDRLNGFNEDFFLYYEDFDLCTRARTRGYNVFYLSDAVVTHNSGASAWQDRKMFFRHLYSSRELYFKKHSSPGGFIVARILIRLGITLRVFAYSIIGTLTANKNLMQLAGEHWWVVVNGLEAKRK